METQDFDIRKNADSSRYELLMNNEVAGFADYSDRGGVRTFPHTVVDPKYRGQGLSSPLIRYALDDARADGMRVQPSCWAVAGFIEKHPEYADLVA